MKTVFDYLTISEEDFKKYLNGKKFIIAINSKDTHNLHKLCQELCQSPLFYKEPMVISMPEYIRDKNQFDTLMGQIRTRYLNSQKIKDANFIIWENDNDYYCDLLQTFIEKTPYKSMDQAKINNKLYSFDKEDFVISIDYYAQDTINRVLRQIADKMDELMHYSIAESILAQSKQFFKNNLKLLVWAGSSGKGKHIHDWSDIDVYFYVDKIPHKDMVKFTDGFRDFPIHVDGTFYSTEELKKQQLCERAIVTLYESQLKQDVVLYKDPQLTLPEIKFENIKGYNKEEIFRAGNDLKRQMYVSTKNPVRNDKRFPEKCDTDTTHQIYNIARIIKAENFLKKLLLRDKNVFSSYARDVDAKFYEYCLANFTNGDKVAGIDAKQFYDAFAKYDTNYIITNRTKPEIVQVILNQAFLLLDMIQLFDIHK